MGVKVTNSMITDLTCATEDSIKDISEIVNTAFVLFTKETKHLVSKLRIINMAGSFEVPKDFKAISSNLKLDKAYLEGIKDPLFLVIGGSLEISKDVMPEDIQSKIEGLLISGSLYCPKALAGSLQQKINHVSGRIAAFDNNAVFIQREAIIDETFLKSLEPKTSLALTGPVKVVSEFDVSLIEGKIESIELFGKMTVLEKYWDTLSKKLVDKTSSKITIIPEGYIYHGGDLKLDSTTIRRFNQSNIYVTGTITFNKDISPELIKDHISKIIVKGDIICSLDQKEVIFDLCQGQFPSFIAYKEKLIVIDNEYNLTEGQLKYTKASAALIVKGILNIEESISPELLDEKVDSIYNYGQISCNSQQMGVIYDKAKENHGEIVDRNSAAKNTAKTDNEKNPQIVNTAYLKL